ncbi:hypothetical protein C8039_08435 [Halogeometricum sp. wsp3]|nr:hypothetical protein C8039_08435 [Halogeometricum sp. wsp3]
MGPTGVETARLRPTDMTDLGKVDRTFFDQYVFSNLRQRSGQRSDAARDDINGCGVTCCT